MNAMTQHEVGTILQVTSAPSQGLRISARRRAVQVRESTGGVGWRWRDATDAEMQKMTEALNGAMNAMTPKEQYEARKAEREKVKDMDYQLAQRTEQIMSLDMLDRFVTAAERIADALERK